MDAKGPPTPATVTPAKGLPAKGPPPPKVIRPAQVGVVARYGNTVLTGILVAAAIVLAVRWWRQSAANARQAVSDELTAARSSVEGLGGQALIRLPPSTLAEQVRLVYSTAGSAISDVINKADDAGVKGRALLVRGDLNWHLANLPTVPGAATQPALRPEVPPDQALASAADAYGAVIGLAGADHGSVAAAKLGLAAVDQNKGDWAAARTRLQAVAGDAEPAVAVYAAIAKAQLTALPDLERPTYLMPPDGSPPLPPPLVIPPTSMSPMMGPFPTTPTTGPTTGPTTRLAK